MVESNSDEILEGADTEDVALLVVGDPFGYVPTFPSNITPALPYVETEKKGLHC